ncbi:tubby C-terminal-like domain-containing protein [Haematococcus lacustris]
MKSQLQAVQQGLTLEQSDASTTVEAFHEAGVPVMARPRSGLAPTMILSTERSISAWEQQLKQLIASGQREAAVKLPAPSAGMVRCYIKRVKNFFGTHCSFQMHLDAGDVFLLAARRRKKSKVSSYVVSLDLEDLKRDTPNCLAKVKANFVGTEYILWQKCDNSIKGEYDREGLCINFKQTALSTKGGPRAMFVVLPLPEVDWHSPDSGAQESLSNSLELAKRRELSPHIERKVAMLSTKPPEWDEHMKAFTLDFHGRVKEASVKNFQLVHWDHNTDRKGADLMLQFGKVEDDVYALDFAYPLNAEMAFAVALASIDTKLCYTL